MVFLQFKFPVNLAQLVVSKMQCHYANAAVQPSLQHIADHIRWYDRQRFILDVETAIFV